MTMSAPVTEVESVQETHVIIRQAEAKIPREFLDLQKSHQSSNCLVYAKSTTRERARSVFIQVRVVIGLKVQGESGCSIVVLILGA